MMRKNKRKITTCHDCGATPTELHQPGCDVEQCYECGSQLISCGCFCDHNWPEDDDRIKWTGIWPGVEECQEFGWYAKFSEGSGWVRCSADEPEATEDLNRLWAGRAIWDKERGRFILAT